ncbi:hypothetical protein RSO01_83890 [Reyranella soli]|uniref:Uncharacterized protein n=1 Tax=Reyranella soli TaxID=1230389 RepID=A0A512NQJ4_9HYPH|nr:hypothetical protein RSO01_83890 [Reyranella soli]
MEWSFRNNHPNIAYMQLYAVEGQRVYPDVNKYYKLDDSDAHPSKIKCWEGEKICYGAWVNKRTEWGVGRDNKHRCKDCCVSCTGGNVGTINLNP